MMAWYVGHSRPRGAQRNMQLFELLDLASKELQQVGIDEFALEARLLLQACLGKTRTEIFLLGNTSVEKEDEERYLRCISRRKKREPVAYILGEQEFWSMRFSVTPAVLIPRPETEFLLDRVLSLADPSNLKKNILDLCCGSGVIAIVLAKETGRKVVASDISFAALEVCRANVQYHGLATHVQLVQADLLSAFRPGRDFSLVVANPPYVSSPDIALHLEPEVAAYEPHLALDGGEEGINFLKRIRSEAPRFLCPGGQLFMEIGAEQGDAARELFTASLDDSPGFTMVDILMDYAGRDRVLHAKMAN